MVDAEYRRFQYETVEYHMNQNPRFFEENKIRVLLKDGSSLSDIVPLQVTQGTTRTDKGESPMLFLTYLTIEGEKVVPVTEILGLRVSQSIDPNLRDKYFLQFNYLNTRDHTKVEEIPREVLVLNISYGIHPLHETVGEKEPDYYWVGQGRVDLEVVNPVVKQYPLWRSGQEGDPLQLRSHFISQSSSHNS